MNLEPPYISWFDLLAVVLLLVGITRGRRRGMSEELLDVLQWLTVVVVAGFLHEPLGHFLAAMSVFSLLWCYVGVYVLLALVIKLTFSVIRRSVGNKLVEGDAFGMGEYYLGMAAGGFRYLCILLVAMAFLNARYFTPQEVKAAL
jgi:uncharacterized membrane protein required for colicin V production